jgi:hypothetical protein
MPMGRRLKKTMGGITGPRIGKEDGQMRSDASLFLEISLGRQQLSIAA